MNCSKNVFNKRVCMRTSEIESELCVGTILSCLVIQISAKIVLKLKPWCSVFVKTVRQFLTYS